MHHSVLADTLFHCCQLYPEQCHLLKEFNSINDQVFMQLLSAYSNLIVKSQIHSN